MGFVKPVKYICTFIILGHFSYIAITPKGLDKANAKEALETQRNRSKKTFIKKIIAASQKNKSNQDNSNQDNSKISIQPRIGVKFTTGPGLGYDGSFTTLEGFLPILQHSNNSFFYLDGKLLLSTDDSLVSSNIVLGHRFYSLKDKRIIGTYVAFDSRDSGENNFDQLGAGFETLGETWDARANFYVPINNVRQLVDESIVETVSPLSLPSFQGNFLVETQTTQRQVNRRFEAAMLGLDFEVGMKLVSLGNTGDVRGYAGIYYYDAPGTNNIVGGRGRLEVSPSDSLKLGLLLSSDDKFGTNIIVSLGASLGGKTNQNRKDKQKHKQKQLIARLTESVIRNTNILVDSQIESESTSQTETLTLTNPTTAQPLKFQHVDLTASTGDGSFENPFNNLTQALNLSDTNDIIYVRGNNTSQILGFTVPNDVQVLSGGISQEINTTQAGMVQLPGSGSGNLPTVTTTVTMSDRSKLSGFNIVSTNGAGVSADNASDFTIENNIVASQTNTAISLENIGGKVTIAKNIIQNSAFGGLSLNNSRPELDLNIKENTVTNIATVNNSNASNAINLEFSNQDSGIINIANNQITNEGNLSKVLNAIDIKLSDSANLKFKVTENTINNNQGNGLNISLEDETVAVFNIQNNKINRNQISGLNVSLSNSSNAEFNISNNTFDQNQIRGVEALLSNSSSATVNINNNSIVNNESEGINLSINDTSTAIVNITNNTGISNRINDNLNGIVANGANNSKLRLLIDSNSISSNSNSGLTIQSFNEANIFTKVESNSLTDNNLQDLEIRTFNNSKICSQINNNQINKLSINDIFGGSLQLEEDNLTNNLVTTSRVNGTTSVPAGTCGF